MDSYRKYFKYKTKYLKYKFKIDNKINLIGGSIPTFYFGHDNEDDIDKYKISIYLFKADWCGHCNNFKKVWNKVGESFQDDKINFIAYDSEKNKQIIDTFKIQGYPTILIRINNSTNNGTNNDTTEYNGGRDEDTFINYIEKLIKENRLII